MDNTKDLSFCSVLIEYISFKSGFYCFASDNLKSAPKTDFADWDKDVSIVLIKIVTRTVEGVGRALTYIVTHTVGEESVKMLRYKSFLEELLPAFVIFEDKMCGRWNLWIS